MKNLTKIPDIKDEFIYLKDRIATVESNLDFVKEPKLVDALSFELLALRARLGYVLERAKRD